MEEETKNVSQAVTNSNNPPQYRNRSTHSTLYQRQPPGLVQYSLKEALMKGTLWPYYDHPYVKIPSKRGIQ